MLDQLYIVSNGGVVLHHKPFSNAKRRTVVNQLIQEYLLEDRAGDTECLIDDMKVRWSLHNNPQFLVVIIYQKFLQMPTVDRFLKDLQALFATTCGAFIESFEYEKVEQSDFAAQCDELCAVFERREKSVVAVGEVRRPERSGAPCDEDEALASPVKLTSSTGGDDAQLSGSKSQFTTKDGKTLTKRGGGKAPAAASPSSPSSTAPVKKKPVKVATVWDKPAVEHEATESESAKPTEEQLQAHADIQRKTFIKRTADGNVAPIQEKVWEGQQRGRLASWLRTYVGSRELDEQDFAAIIPNLREKLITKNVAVEVAEHVCKSVETSLKGTKIGTFESLHGVVEQSMMDALRRILQPKHEVNLLRSVAAAVARQRPYSIVLCGVNGVGKSTSLSKIAYWLQQNGHSLLIAAGDTFRHGAVEQLEVHGRCLGVPIFQLGYGTDPSAVAAAAIQQAQKSKTHVVLIDTAGRMQDHESRMRALAKLIHDNQPDLVLFVGEALVGNNGVDQLRKFNQCLFDFTPVSCKPRGIDGIVLTKFDTIDDKVGAALSMVYELGQPIVFVGVGQTYQDLKVIEAEVVVSALMQ